MELRSEIKAIVLDLDGTLLDSQKKVSERNRKAILECLKKGIKVIFATARAPRSVKVFLPHELQDIATMIYYNGALVVDNALSYRQHYPIESAITNEIIEFVITHQADACLSVESEDTWYSNKTLDYNKTMNAIVNPIVVPLNELKKVSASKLLISQYTHYEKLQKQFAHKVSTICTDTGTLTQIMAKGVSKERAVREICAQNNISMGNIMVFGDDWNDLELFYTCGFPIAMGNAIPELKNTAYFITDTNDEDGVAQVLEKLICTVNNS